MLGKTIILFKVTLLLASLSIMSCNVFDARDVPEDISGTWSGTITENSVNYSITFRFNHTAALVTGSWTAAIRGNIESGGLSGSYYDGKGNFTLFLNSIAIGNMLLRFDDDTADGTGTERGISFTITIKEI